MKVYRCVRLVAVFVMLFRPCEMFAGPAGKSTWTYKKAGSLEIKLDVYRPEGTKALPVVVSIHGGGLMKMDRSSIYPPADLLLQRGFIIASVDYRLAPETKLPDMIQDVVDACAWIRREGPRLFGADARRLAVVGASAGGFLALAAGFRLDPKPDVVVSVFGFGEIVGSWATRPSPDPEHWETRLSDEEAARIPKSSPVSNASERAFDILPYYNYYRQKGLWPKMLTGWDAFAEREKYLPHLPLYNVTSGYPVTMLIHGTRDPDVPVEQSKMLAARFRAQGVKHETIFLEGAEHGLRGIDPNLAQAAYAAAADFVVRHLLPDAGGR